jgi:hypothetical protein
LVEDLARSSASIQRSFIEGLVRVSRPGAKRDELTRAGPAELNGTAAGPALAERSALAADPFAIALLEMGGPGTTRAYGRMEAGDRRQVAVASA